MEKATARTVVNTGEYQAHPRRTPLNPSAAPATATATAAPITQGWAPGPSRRDAAPGDRTVGSSVPAFRRRSAAALRCEGHSLPPAPRRTSAAADIPGSARRRRPMRQAARSGQIPPRPAIRRAAALPVPQDLAGSCGWSVTSSAKALAPNPAAGDSARASARVRLPRTARIGPRSRCAESLSIRASSKGGGRGAGPRGGRGLGGILRAVAVRVGVLRTGELDGGQAFRDGLQPGRPGVLLRLGSGADGEFRKAGAPALSRNRRV